MNKLWYYSLAIGSLAGTIIGVGMFGLPFVALKSGFFLMVFYLIVFGIIVGFTHLLYLEVTFRTSTPHRFTGYVGKYLGPRWKRVTFAQGLISLWGTLLLYTILTGQFLHLLIPSPFLSPTILGALFFLLGVVIIGKGDRAVGKQELLFTLPMAVLIAVLFFKSLASPSFSQNLLVSLNWSEWIAPYGITLFALAGFSIIPILEHILAPARREGLTFNYPFITFAGTLLPAFLYILFVWGVLGVSGVNTTSDALSGLVKPLGNGIVKFGALLGVLAMYTSFIALGNELERTFFEDYRFSRAGSLILSFLPPFLLYLLNVRDFITIAEFVGALMGGYIGVMSILLLWKARELGDAPSPFTAPLPKPFGIFLILIFSFASLYALIDIVSPFILSPFSN